MYDYILFYLQSAVEGKNIFKLTDAAAPLPFILEIRLPYGRWLRAQKRVNQMNFSLTLAISSLHTDRVCVSAGNIDKTWMLILFQSDHFGMNNLTFERVEGELIGLFL